MQRQSAVVPGGEKGASRWRVWASRVRSLWTGRLPRVRFGLLLALLALAQGLWYANAIPPWWNYDEPRHFWLAWTLVRGEITEADKRRLARSLLEYDWFHHYPHDLWPTEEDYNRFPAVFSPSGRPWHRQLYWRLVSLPWYLVPREWDLAWQLRVLRWTSVLLFFPATVWLLWKAAQELFGREHPLARVLPLFTVFLPGFAEPMSLLNDDTGAAFAGALFFWAGLRLLRRGWHRAGLAWLLVAAVVAQSMKRTSLPLVAAVPFVLLFAWRWRRRWVPWFLAVAAVALGMVAGLRKGDPAYWYHDRVHPFPLRVASSQAVDGAWVFRVPPQTTLGQWIPPQQYNDYPPSSTLYLSFWVWADRPGKMPGPRLCAGRIGYGLQVQACTKPQALPVTTSPQYVVVPLTWLEGNFGRMEFPGHSQALGQVYLDAIALTEAPPEPEETPGVNLVRNGSAEQAWWYVGALVASRIPGSYGASPSVALAALQDHVATRMALRVVLASYFRTAWGHFARAKIPYLGHPVTYHFLFGWTLVAVAGFGWLLLRRRPEGLTWTVVAFLALGAALVIGGAVFYVLGRLYRSFDLLTWFRYILAATFPLAVVLVGGWYAWLGPRRILWVVRFAWWLNLLAWWSIASFFYPKVFPWGYIVLVVLFATLSRPRFEGWLQWPD